MTKQPIHIAWFRRDLRISDNAALTHALNQKIPVVALYIFDEAAPIRPLGGASKWWLHHSLLSLESSLKTLGIPLLLKNGRADHIFKELIDDYAVTSVTWQFHHDPGMRLRDKQVADYLQQQGIQAQIFPGNTLWDPATILTKQKHPYAVFTPFWHTCTAQDQPQFPLSVPEAQTHTIVLSHSDRLDDWALVPSSPDWACGIKTMWNVGESAALAHVKHFISTALSHYHTNRDIPGIQGTSLLSPHLHFGEISVNQAWHAVQTNSILHPDNKLGADCFLRELGWREFCAYLLYHHPHLLEQPFQRGFQTFPWKDDPVAFRAWSRGLTGYPIVDAGMRQLWQTGWMHNRVRMIVGSFLTKHLLLPWQQGEAWFFDTLVDADLASNIGGWQWIAGCGADAAPYFRIFNPQLQSERFDPQGTYIKAYLPELANLPAPWIHKPWETPESILRQAGIELGKTYPPPIIEHSKARDRAMAAYQQMKRS
ncbi:MAG: deoxyribodipyrimidine photo-lyase [Alphaproteobacteria bacterium]|nr:deoxyribodipyrimidine photo-lyase [Alphaproteobacteria bacterium]